VAHAASSAAAAIGYLLRSSPEHRRRMRHDLLIATRQKTKLDPVLFAYARAIVLNYTGLQIAGRAKLPSFAARNWDPQMRTKCILVPSHNLRQLPRKAAKQNSKILERQHISFFVSDKEPTKLTGRIVDSSTNPARARPSLQRDTKCK
jgi:hypothetical protein